MAAAIRSHRVPTCLGVGALVAALLVPRADAHAQAGGQGVDVIVTSVGAKPIHGALISLRNQSDSVLVRRLTDERGRVRLAWSAGRYRLRVDAIGFEGRTEPVVEIGAAGFTRVAVELAKRPLMIAELVVTSGPASCKQSEDRASAVARLWEEARKVLVATQVTSTSEAPVLDYKKFERDVDRHGRITNEVSTQGRTASHRPFVSIDPAILRREGYVHKRAGDTWYSAPDANVLLSTEFIADHCFGIVWSDSGPRLVGLLFEPVRGIRRPDVGGVLWLDPATSELRYVSYEYRNLPLPDGAVGVGGRIEFRRLDTGGWIVNDWHIRMPRLGALLQGTKKRDTLLGYRETGGAASPVLGRGSPLPQGRDPLVSLSEFMGRPIFTPNARYDMD